MLGKVILLGPMIAGSPLSLAGNGGNTGMFGLFKPRVAPLPSVVATELGVKLKRETVFPAHPPALPQPGYDHCAPVRVRGVPPHASFTGDGGDEATSSGFRVAAHAGQPALALVNISDLISRLEIWELSAEATPAFTRQRMALMDPAQASWGAWRALDVACLPGDRLAIGLYYANPHTQHALFVYDITTQAFHKIGPAVLDSSTGVPERSFETWPVSAGSAMVLWHSGEVRVKAEVYVREHDHLMLFSPRHPQGIEVLSLGLDDGNIVRRAMVGQTLWIETVDARALDKPAHFVWSLDLTQAL